MVPCPDPSPLASLAGIFSAALRRYNANHILNLTPYEFAELVLPQSAESKEIFGYGFYFAGGPMLTYHGPGSMTRTVRASLLDLDDVSDLVARFRIDSYPSEQVMVHRLIHFLESRFGMFI
jgi:hypothetical protein